MKGKIPIVSEYSISNMRMDDVDDVLNIERLSFKTPWSREDFVSELQNNKFAIYRIIIKDNHIAGYGGMWVLIDEAHITNIAIHPEYRGVGFGNILINDMIKTAKENGAVSMTLEVRVSNEKAIKLYKKYGFIEVAIRKGYYADTKEDGIIMWKYNI